MEKFKDSSNENNEEEEKKRIKTQMFVWLSKCCRIQVATL